MTYFSKYPELCNGLNLSEFFARQTTYPQILLVNPALWLAIFKKKLLTQSLGLFSEYFADRFKGTALHPCNIVGFLI